MSKNTKDKDKDNNDKEVYIIEGKVQLETLNELPGDVDLVAYAFSDKGKLLKAAPVNMEGKYKLRFKSAKSPDITLHIGTEEDKEKVKKSSLYSRNIQARDWAKASENNVLPVVAYLPKLVWNLWWPKQICVSGHVRKDYNCPIPYTRVEIFDVDRHWCFWPHLHRFRDLLRNKLVLRLEDIINTIPDIPDLVREFPPPFDPQFSPVSLKENSFTAADSGAGLLPDNLTPTRAISKSDFSSISSVPNIDISRITATSRLAPWILFPGCYYHKHLICTTTTDEDGYFRCCFTWRPSHGHHGHHGHSGIDYRPDIIIRVTQVIDGVSKIIYMDPYANTRWNVNNLHVDLFLDDPDIVCGEPDDQNRPEGAKAFFTRIGNDEVFKINQVNGTYSKSDAISNMAYGSALNIYAQFGETLSKHQNIPGATGPYYFKLLYDGTPMTAPLKDYRVHKTTSVVESYTLGPKPVDGETALYEIRDFEDYNWYNPDLIGRWVTAKQSTDLITNELVITKNVPDGIKELKLEIYDDLGNLLDSSKVEYLDGTSASTGILDTKYPCTMKIAIDNNPPVFDMQVSPLPTGCGVIQSSAVPPLDVTVSASQANNRVSSWSLTYVKGTNPTVIGLGPDSSGSSNSGGAGVNNHTVHAESMLAGLTTTCAFSLKLGGWAHVRNGINRIYYRESRQAIAIEYCP